MTNVSDYSKGKLRLLCLFVGIWITLLIILLVIIRNLLFMGIDPRDVKLQSEIKNIEFMVTEIRDDVKDSEYTVYFINKADSAPSFQSSFHSLPENMELGSVYNAQWLHTDGSYRQYSRDKDLISMQYTGVVIDSDAVQMIETEVTEALVSALTKLVRPSFYIVCIICVVLMCIGVGILSKFADSVLDNLLQPTEWDLAYENMLQMRQAALESKEGIIELSKEYLSSPAFKPFIKREYTTDEEFAASIASVHEIGGNLPPPLVAKSSNITSVKKSVTIEQAKSLQALRSIKR